MTFDFAGSSGAVKGPLNSSYAATSSAVFLYLKHVFHEVPINGGCFRPLHVLHAPGTFLDAQYPRAVSGCASEVTVRIGDALLLRAAAGHPRPHRRLLVRHDLELHDRGLRRGEAAPIHHVRLHGRRLRRPRGR